LHSTAGCISNSSNERSSSGLSTLRDQRGARGHVAHRAQPSAASRCARCEARAGRFRRGICLATGPRCRATSIRGRCGRRIAPTWPLREPSQDDDTKDSFPFVPRHSSLEHMLLRVSVLCALAACGAKAMSIDVKPPSQSWWCPGCRGTTSGRTGILPRPSCARGMAW